MSRERLLGDIAFDEKYINCFIGVQVDSEDPKKGRIVKLGESGEEVFAELRRLQKKLGDGSTFRMFRPGIEEDTRNSLIIEGDK